MNADQLANLIIQYYQKDGNGAGGNLHLVLDDGNMDDVDIRYCRLRAHCEGDNDGVTITNKLLKLTEDEREKIIDKAIDEIHRMWYEH